VCVGMAPVKRVGLLQGDFYFLESSRCMKILKLIICRMTLICLCKGHRVECPMFRNDVLDEHRAFNFAGAEDLVCTAYFEGEADVNCQANQVI